ncbi:MAG: hypothetical protein ABWY06_18460 [Pseudomonas sp.]|uniref:hypothetical protein n=1 Tax=Pseudomonas sp. TaxID=306 RepID=UPI003394B92F
MPLPDIDHLWQDGTLPMVNGIVSQKNHVMPFTITGYGPERKILPGLAYDLNKFLSTDDAVLSSIGSLAELILKGRADVAKAICGEGSWGSDGFVVVLDDKDHIVWVAAFECSNPFIQLIHRGDELIAVNNNDERWAFPLSNPDSFYIDINN